MKAKEKRELVCITCPDGLPPHRGKPGRMAVSTYPGTFVLGAPAMPRTRSSIPAGSSPATCRTDSERHPRLPVRTEGPCPKDRIEVLLELIYSYTAELPVKTGDPLFTDETGIRVLAARTLKN